MQMHLGICMCVYVCKHVCVSEYGYTDASGYMYVCVYVCKHICVSECGYADASGCMYVCVCM